MSSMRFGMGRLARLVRGRRLDRNPLRRACDRAETVILGAVIAGFLAAAPFAAHAAGNWAYAASGREAQAQRAGLSEIPATLLQAPAHVTSYPGAGSFPPSVDARWRAPDGLAGEVRRVAGLPRRLTLRVLDRRRMAAWDADWLATGPRWSPRR
jgi:hypothetical protein